MQFGYGRVLEQQYIYESLQLNVHLFYSCSDQTDQCQHYEVMSM